MTTTIKAQQRLVLDIESALDRAINQFDSARDRYDDGKTCSATSWLQLTASRVAGLTEELIAAKERLSLEAEGV